MNCRKKKETALLGMLLVAMIGIGPFTQSGCDKLMVVDEETGQLRPATEEEAKAIVKEVGDITKIVAVGSGNPQFLPLIDLGTRLAILVMAFLYKRKKLDNDTEDTEAPTDATRARSK